MQFININRIKEYFYKRQNRILVILSLSVLFLVVKEIPFLNIFFPDNAAFGVALISILILFKLYKNTIFIIFLAFFSFILYITEVVNHADQLAVLILVCLTVYMLEEATVFLRNEIS
ncbi:MAG: hypothetical protein A2186_03230 [Candidatus Levybacteria bacterium RIFOXYA1_FULL_41_10]|nr:MAG: hypothetical protein US02_C0001G0028 [Candidatus Levybacteria bacterium GW2011_GWA2_36_13]KKQ00998.1 MAG: hypothetical protein US07_C0003G0036 [Candidatus Levybacteria bacterium GW2011_GWB1_36_18]KKR15365.1 MAG: hypothetical protein UT44_C0036G0002 [Candidatus Levybacteria bacterium GW2011_GWA1_39_32]KKR72909.1 MAG: hypothetical protein UU15_C0024G0010 [Candidatus Levybacteria bacterium GW2011_GWC2_40_7]OGH20851.1 MAG: hypothetical protein A2695_00490 [Candidatus Levybacteria bacterium 